MRFYILLLINSIIDAIKRKACMCRNIKLVSSSVEEGQDWSDWDGNQSHYCPTDYIEYLETYSCPDCGITKNKKRRVLK